MKRYIFICPEDHWQSIGQPPFYQHPGTDELTLTGTCGHVHRIVMLEAGMDPETFLCRTVS